MLTDSNQITFLCNPPLFSIADWPSFNPGQLSWSGDARQQFGRAYSDIQRYPAAAKRKSGLLRWIHASAYDSTHGVHLPVTAKVAIAAPYGPNRSREFSDAELNFPEMPCGLGYFSNALIIGDEKPSFRATNAGRIVVTHEIDAESVEEFEEVLKWTRGANGDSNKSAFATVHRHLCECGEYRGFSIVYSGRRSLHFHFLFDTKHLVNAPWDADSLKRRELQRETAALMCNVHDRYWDHTGDCIDEILRPSRARDPSMKSFTKWRRMPWGVRVIEERKECGFLNLMPGDIVPQLVIQEKILERASRNSELLLPSTFSTSHPSKTKSRSQIVTELGSDEIEAIRLMQEQCRIEWGVEFPKPVKIQYRSGEPFIYFQNHEHDETPSSFVSGDYRKLFIVGNGGPVGDSYLPDHMSAAEFVDFVLRRCGRAPSQIATTKAPALALLETGDNAKFGGLPEFVTRRFYSQPIFASKAEAQIHQRRHLQLSISELRLSEFSYLIKTAEGFGKTTAHFALVADDMLYAMENSPESSTLRFGCFAFRSNEQAEQKANEFRAHVSYFGVVVLRSFAVIYREFCEQEGEEPIDRDEAAQSGLSSWLDEIRARQPCVYNLLESFRTGFWAENAFDARTIIFTTHAVVQTWSGNFTTRLWLHPDFDPESLEPQLELARSFSIDQIAFDELEIDGFLDILTHETFIKIAQAQDANRNWRNMKRFDRQAVYYDTEGLSNVDSFDLFDRLMRADLKQFTQITVDFEKAPFGHGTKNVYEQRNAEIYHVGIREWPFEGWRIAYLTTESLTSRAVKATYQTHREQRRACQAASGAATLSSLSNVAEPKPSLIAWQKIERHRTSLQLVEVPDSPALYPIKVPVFIDARARADQAGKRGVTALAKEILEANPQAMVICNGVKEKLDRVQNFQLCKGKNDLQDKDIYIVLTHLAVDQYAELNVVGQWLGISNIIQLFYIDQLNQAIGRNSGFRDTYEAQVCVIISNRLFKSVINDCSRLAESRFALYETSKRPW